MKPRDAIAYFVTMGWTEAQAVGIVANLVAESNLNPGAVGDGGLAFGVAQWHPDRQANFAAIIGKDIRGSSIEEQLAFVHAELSGTEKAAGDALRSCTSAREAAACVSKLYERPANAEAEAARRGAIAATLVDTEPAPPAVQPTPQPTGQPKGGDMGAIGLLLPAIVQMIPQLIGIFGKGARAEANAKAAQVVADTFTKAVPDAVNLQDAVEKAQADPTIAAQAKAAVLAEPTIETLLTIGPTGIKEARTANVEFVGRAQKWWQLVLNPVLLVTLLTLPLVYMFVYGLMPLLNKVSSDVIAQTMGTVIGLVLGGIMGFWMGQTYQQNINRRTSDQPGISAGGST